MPGGIEGAAPQGAVSGGTGPDITASTKGVTPTGNGKPSGTSSDGVTLFSLLQGLSVATASSYITGDGVSESEEEVSPDLSENNQNVVQGQGNNDSKNQGNDSEDSSQESSGGGYGMQMAEGTTAAAAESAQATEKSSFVMYENIQVMQQDSNLESQIGAQAALNSAIVSAQEGETAAKEQADAQIAQASMQIAGGSTSLAFNAGMGKSSEANTAYKEQNQYATTKQALGAKPEVGSPTTLSTEKPPKGGYTYTANAPQSKKNADIGENHQYPEDQTTNEELNELATTGKIANDDPQGSRTQLAVKYLRQQSDPAANNRTDTTWTPAKANKALENAQKEANAGYRAANDTVSVDVRARQSYGEIANQLFNGIGGVVGGAYNTAAAEHKYTSDVAQAMSQMDTSTVSMIASTLNMAQSAMSMVQSLISSALQAEQSSNISTGSS